MPWIPNVYVAPALALAVAALGALLCRGKRWRGVLPAIAPLSVLLGWAALAAMGGELKAAWSPRAGPSILLAPTLAALVVSLVQPGRWGRWAAVALALFTAWWLGQAPAARPEFWRVWAASLVLCAVFAWSVRREPGRALASGTALFVGLILAGASPGWREAALVMVAAAAGSLPGGAGAAVPGVVVASLVIAADLALGRLVRGGVGLADAACLAAGAAPFLVAPIARGVGKRAGGAGPFLGAVLAGVLAAGFAWLVQRALIR